MHLDICMYFITLQSPACFGHSCGHLQGGDDKNTNTTIMCQNHSTTKNHIVFIKIQVEQDINDTYKILEFKKLLYGVQFYGMTYSAQ